jgi:hypothetical protein
MKILLTMVLAMGLCVSSLEAQQDLRVATEESLTEQSQQGATKQRRHWLGEMDISAEQWGLIKAERQKFGVVMKAARDGMREQLNIILTPEQQESLKAKREEWRLKAGQWRSDRGERGKNDRGHRRGNRKPKLPLLWKTWDDDAKREWRQERKTEWQAKREQRKERRAARKQEVQTEAIEKD